MANQQQITENFLKYLEAVGYSPHSCKMLGSCVESFMNHLSPKYLSETETTDILAFHEWLKVRPNQRRPGGLSEQYIHHHLYALQVFFGWLEQTGQIRQNPMSTLQFKGPKNDARKPLTHPETKALFKASETLKDTAILHLFYSCGLRRSEGVSLDVRDVHFKKQKLYVRKGKGAKRRVVPLTGKVATVFKTYYEEERMRESRSHEAFILSRRSNRMSGNDMNRHVQKLSETAHLNRPVSLHDLRHSIATHLLESGLSVEYVRDFLGHRYLEATQIYTKVSRKQLKNL